MTAPGLEPITGQEVTRLGYPIQQVEPGGLTLSGNLLDAALLNLELRTGSRVLVRRAAFHARALGELERKAGELPWQDWLPPGPVRLRVTSRKSRLYHHRAVAQRISKAIAGSGIEVAQTGTDPDSEQQHPVEQQLIVVRLFRDECSISVDSSGEHLHRRGYRLSGGKAPLRETLAAAMLLASEWDGTMPLLDPFCGSGTLPIEAALLARSVPPGHARPFAIERWPGFMAEAWARQKAERLAAVRSASPVIIGSDRDKGAVERAIQNAERAGVADAVSFRQATISELAPPAGTGALVSNPPYGVRVGDRRALRDLYARLGQVARDRLAGWRLTLLLPQAPLERDTGLRFDSLFETSNGGVSVRCLRTRMSPAAPGLTSGHGIR